MQFLIYLTVLMVSISTVLLEVHWLTSPPPQPKPAVHAANAAPPPRKVEGPTDALSPVYPKASETASVAAAAANPEQEKPAAETTGVAARTEDDRQETATTSVNRGNISPGADNRQGFTAAAAQAAAPVNRCDVQACSSAYQSFRASDCTYQPFEGPRRVCEKTPVQRTAREQEERTERRQWSRDAVPRDSDRTVGRRVYADPDDSGADDDLDRITIFRTRGPRW